MLILDDPKFYSQLLTNTCFPFADPFGVRLKNRENLLLLWDLFVVKNSSIDLIGKEFAIFQKDIQTRDLFI